MPKRIQLRRQKGWRMPPGAVKVDRTTAYGNRYRVGDRYRTARGGWAKIRDAAQAVDLFRRLDMRHFRFIAPLRGKDLACWCRLCDAHQDGKPLGVDCPDCAPCHADVIGEVVNRPLAAVE